MLTQSWTHQTAKISHDAGIEAQELLPFTPRSASKLSGEPNPSEQPLDELVKAYLFESIRKHTHAVKSLLDAFITDNPNIHRIGVDFFSGDTQSTSAPIQDEIFLSQNTAPRENAPSWESDFVASCADAFFASVKKAVLADCETLHREPQALLASTNATTVFKLLNARILHHTGSYLRKMERRLMAMVRTESDRDKPFRVVRWEGADYRLQIAKGYTNEVRNGIELAPHIITDNLRATLGEKTAAKLHWLTLPSRADLVSTLRMAIEQSGRNRDELALDIMGFL